MIPIETELAQLKSEIISMWKLVSEQMKKSMEALLKMDKALAEEVSVSEKKVNSLELKIDRSCENIFALYNPVAIDLRLVLALLRMNTSLERIGDIAARIAKFIKKSGQYNYDFLMEQTRTLEMFEEACDLVQDTLESFENQNVDLAKRIFKRDELLNEINRNAVTTIINHVKNNPNDIEQCLNMLSIIRKLERAGDQCKNISEEIIFYLDAIVLKHSPKDKLE
jgi:phosphate transport system protein